MSSPYQRWGPPVVWASLILIATSVPVPGALASVPPSGADKLVHGALYAVLAWLTHRSAGSASVRRGIAVLAVISLFGAADEWHQGFIPGRTPEAADWVADTLGAGAGILAFQMARRRRESVS